MTKEIKVKALKEGSVLDHIPPKKSMEVLKILNLLKVAKENTIIPAINLPSKKLGKKDIIKIENVFLTAKDLEVLWFIAPGASVSIIKNGEVVKKIPIRCPEKIVSILECPNEDCITNHGPQETKFTMYKDKNCLCEFCERIFPLEELKIKYNSQ